MTTSKVQLLFALLFKYSITDAILLITPDTIGYWTGSRQFTHFTRNPTTKKTSWITFPEAPTKDWTREMIESAKKFSAGKPSITGIDHPTFFSEFWDHNNITPQNNIFFTHLVLDSLYINYLSKYIDTSNMHNNLYIYNKKIYSGTEYLTRAEERWNGESLASSFDTQMFIALAKRLYQTSGIISNRNWFEKEFFSKLHEMYSQELAEKTINSITMTDFTDDTITSREFDYKGPVLSEDVNKFIDLAITICTGL